MTSDQRSIRLRLINRSTLIMLLMFLFFVTFFNFFNFFLDILCVFTALHNLIRKITLKLNS